MFDLLRVLALALIGLLAVVTPTPAMGTSPSDTPTPVIVSEPVEDLALVLKMSYTLNWTEPIVPAKAPKVNVKTYIPVKAFNYLPTLVSEVDRLMPKTPSTAYFGALVEQESCISLTHKRCWDPTSELKSAREQGVGLGQITRAYRADGTERFDALTEMKNKYNEELKELSWLTVKERPDLQIKTIVLMIRDNFKALFEVKDVIERLKMADVVYNGGPRDLNKERMTCGLTKGCDPQKWFDNVELHCVKSKKPLYGTRSACDINREHPRYIFKVRLPKYQKQLDRS